MLRRAASPHAARLRLDGKFRRTSNGGRLTEDFANHCFKGCHLGVHHVSVQNADKSLLSAATRVIIMRQSAFLASFLSLLLAAGAASAQTQSVFNLTLDTSDLVPASSLPPGAENTYLEFLEFNVALDGMYTISVDSTALVGVIVYEGALSLGVGGITGATPIAQIGNGVILNDMDTFALQSMPAAGLYGVLFTTADSIIALPGGALPASITLTIDGPSAATAVVPMAPVPEPGTYALMGLGLVGLAAWSRRRRVAA